MTSRPPLLGRHNGGQLAPNSVAHSELVRRRGGLISVPGGKLTLPPEITRRFTKLLLNVNIQGSLGPVQVVMSPENAVGDLIKAAIEIYVKEMRRPLLNESDPRRLELHYSQFSLESLKAEEKLINLGSRNFYLCGKPTSVANSTCSDEAKKASNPSPGLKKDGWEQAKMGDLLAWLLFFFVLIIIIVIVVYQLMCLADLEFDYINPYDSASRINKMIMPEFITQGVLCFLYLITGHWFMSLLSVPYLYYNVRVYMLRQHLVDVTEIFNSLHWEKKRRFFKLGYLVFLLCISLFWTIWNSLEEEEQAF